MAVSSSHHARCPSLGKKQHNQQDTSWAFDMGNHLRLKTRRWSLHHKQTTPNRTMSLTAVMVVMAAAVAVVQAGSPASFGVGRSQLVISSAAETGELLLRPAPRGGGGTSVTDARGTGQCCVVRTDALAIRASCHPSEPAPWVR